MRVEVVNRDTGEVVATTIDAAAEPNSTNTATWDGLASDGTPAPNGDYQFRIGDAAGSGAQATAKSDFGYHQYRFPLQSKHSYGDGFGAGRGHQGQDVFAKCGAPIRAVRGGRVQVNSTQSRAGNYVVIDGKGTGVDTMYAHLIRRSPLRKGRARSDRAADRQRRPDGQRERLSSPLRDLDGAGVVRGREPDAERRQASASLGRLELR